MAKLFKMLLLVILLAVIPRLGLSQCNVPNGTYISPVYTNSAQIQYTCCITGTYYIEYGLSGFIPGTDSVAGTGGIVVQGQANPGIHVISGLSFNTLYDVYIRVFCNTGVFTANSIVKTFRTAQFCSAAQPVTCGNDYQVVLPSGLGAWYNYLCSFSGALGREKLYRYTATVTGNHIFYVSTSSGNTNRVSFRYKSDTLPCNDIYWNCLLTASTSGSQTLGFGPLTAGKTYWILADAEIDTVSPDTVSFRVECPAVSCPTPTSISIVGLNPQKIKLNYTGSSAIFEFGPPGFTPGTTNWPPGTNGSIYNVNPGSEISGFTPGAILHGYLRSKCNAGSWTYYSANAGPIWFQVPYCTPPWTFDPINGSIGLQFNSSWSFGQNKYDGICYPGAGVGEDERFIFSSPKTAHYTASIDISPYLNLEMAMKSYNAVCLPSSYTCLPFGPFGSSPYKVPLGILDKDSVFDFIMDTWDTTETFVDFFIECSGPSNVSANNISYSSFDINWSCDCIDTVFLEIGPKGFTPGTGYNAGTNGSLVFTTDTFYTFSNLNPFTKYDVYLRSSCVTYFSANRKVSVYTPKNCQQAPVVTCGSNVNHSFNITTGAWGVQACNGGGLGAEEHIYRFTQTQTGMYKVYVYDLTSNWTGYAFTVKFFYKHDSLGCNPDNWNCIGQIVSTLPAFVPHEFTFGPLTAGETYYIMTDGVDWDYRYHTFHAQLLCQDTCSGPVLLAAYPIHPDGAIVFGSCVACLGQNIVEVGPQGFSPGAGTQAGANGTVYTNVTFPFIFNGLSPGTTYEVYVRSDCSGDTSGFTTGFSNNSDPLTISPCSTTPGAIFTSGVNNIICEGDSITLYRNGGVAAPGTIYRWYEGGCGFGNFLGIGDSIVVFPLQTKTYFLRAEAPCGNSGCVNIQIVVSNIPPVFTGTTNICPGDTAQLGLQNGYSQYLWSTGDTTETLSVTTLGFYSVTVTNSDGCTVSAGTPVLMIPFTFPQIVGNYDLCAGDSTTLFAGPGYSDYLWSNGSNSAYLTTSDSGMYVVTVTNSYGCEGTDSIYVNLHQGPAVVIYSAYNLSFCIGDSILLAATSGLTGYQWIHNNNLIPGAYSQQLWIRSAGNYYCLGIDNYECQNTSNLLSATTPCIDIGPPHDKLQSEAAVSDTFSEVTILSQGSEQPVIRIQCKENVSLWMEIFDSLGKRVNASAEKIQNENYRIRIDGPPGVYFLNLKCGNEVRNLKLLKGL